MASRARAALDRGASPCRHRPPCRRAATLWRVRGLALDRNKGQSMKTRILTLAFLSLGGCAQMNGPLDRPERTSAVDGPGSGGARRETRHRQSGLRRHPHRITRRSALRGNVPPLPHRLPSRRGALLYRGRFHAFGLILRPLLPEREPVDAQAAILLRAHQRRRRRGSDGARRCDGGVGRDRRSRGRVQLR